MLALIVMRLALQTCSTLLGSFGVFFLYLSLLQPAMLLPAALLLGGAAAIVWSVPQN
ncbi:MAG TPA: hypothetical protein VME41_02935 [Stellaceae bacterium]|nr:hypothetical protein [Stellaceae bacterium]